MLTQSIIAVALRTALLMSFSLVLGACASLPNRDPLTIDVAGIEGLPSEGMELRLAVSIRIQNPNDVAVEYTGVALGLDLNGHRLGSGVSDKVGTVPRYGETVFTVPVTISAFNVARQVLGFMNGASTGEVSYRVRGKLEGGLFGTRRFSDDGTFRLDLPAETR
jgi:LEA14-like dessication related protein